MCVVMIVPHDDKRPTDAIVKAGWESNSFGGGVGWIDREKNVAKWKKGIENVKEMQDFAATLPVPFVLHFRIPSVGGDCNELTHPFPLLPDASTALAGESPGGVLFHNGTWHKWEERLLQFTYGTGTPLPDGKWSDSRAMAYLAYWLSPNVLEFVGEKIAVLIPDDGSGEPDVLTWGNWNFDDGIWYSNMGWKSRISWQGTDRGLLRREASGKGSTYHTTAPASMSGGEKQTLQQVRQHSVDCVCQSCAEEDITRRIATGFGGGPSSPTQAAGGGLTQPPTLEEIKEAYQKLSKKQLKRLRKKQLYSKKALPELERRVVLYANMQEKKAEDMLLREHRIIH